MFCLSLTKSNLSHQSVLFASYAFLFENMLKYNMLLSLEKVNKIMFPFCR